MNEFEDEKLAATFNSWDKALEHSGTANRHGMNARVTPDTGCISAPEIRQAYLDLVASRACNDGMLCLNEACDHCLPLLVLIDARGDDCDQRGCGLSRCVYDPA